LLKIERIGNNKLWKLKEEIMDTSIIIGGFGLIIGGFGLISTVLFFSMNRIHNDITGLSSRMDASNSIMDSQFSKFSSRMDSHASRIDQLYQMFVDLVKERK
tara:strand:+ start:2170 stop:2475 length:306 start_codon:yes stop_codon:yes gene_type:complete